MLQGPIWTWEKQASIRFGAKSILIKSHRNVRMATKILNVFYVILKENDDILMFE